MMMIDRIKMFILASVKVFRLHLVLIIKGLRGGGGKRCGLSRLLDQYGSG